MKQKRFCVLGHYGIIHKNNQVVSDLLRKVIPPNSEMSTKLTTSNLTPWKESDDHSRQHIKGQRHYFANKGLV